MTTTTTMELDYNATGPDAVSLLIAAFIECRRQGFEPNFVSFHRRTLYGTATAWAQRAVSEVEWSLTVKAKKGLGLGNEASASAGDSLVNGPTEPLPEEFEVERASSADRPAERAPSGSRDRLDELPEEASQ